MKIEITMPELYKNYMIVGVAIEAPRLKGWKFKGIIYSKSGKELKQLEVRQSTSRTRKALTITLLKDAATGLIFMGLNWANY